MCLFVLSFFLLVTLWNGLRCVVEVFTGHTHLLFYLYSVIVAFSGHADMFFSYLVKLSHILRKVVSFSIENKYVTVATKYCCKHR